MHFCWEFGSEAARAVASVRLTWYFRTAAGIELAHGRPGNVLSSSAPGPWWTSKVMHAVHQVQKLADHRAERTTPDTARIATSRFGQIRHGSKNTMDEDSMPFCFLSSLSCGATGSTKFTKAHRDAAISLELTVARSCFTLLRHHWQPRNCPMADHTVHLAKGAQRRSGLSPVYLST